METFWTLLGVYLAVGAVVAYITMYTGPYGIRIDGGPFILWVAIWPLALVARQAGKNAARELARRQREDGSP